MLVCEYPDATIRYDWEDHPTLHGMQVLLEAFHPDAPELFVERGVVEWHFSDGHGRERYGVLLETELWDEDTRLDLEVWESRFFSTPFSDPDED